MKAIGVAKYGDVSNFEARKVEEPAKPKGRELLVEVKAMSVNPIDVKIRNGSYDDAPDFYDHVPKPFHIVGVDGGGVVLEAGPDVKWFTPGDEIFWARVPNFQGSAAERQIVHENMAAHKPKSMDLVQAAAFPVTYGTAYEALHERLGIETDEQAAILIINGAGGVGSMASQIARNVLNLPVVITTASRPETIEWSKNMGATHVINHRQDLQTQIKALNLGVPLKYIFIIHSTAQYLAVCAEICAPMGKVCTIVQSSVDFYGTKFMSKSLTFAWCWLGTRAYHGYDEERQHFMMEELSTYCDSGKIKSHLTKRFRLTKEGLKNAHLAVESNVTIGKVGLGVDEEGEDELFA